MESQLVQAGDKIVELLNHKPINANDPNNFESLTQKLQALQ